MVKMEASEHVVDYAPADAHPAPDAAMPEHEPERHLDHTSPERREAPTQQAPIAPSGKKQMTPMEDHTGHSAPPAEAHDESTGAGEVSTPSGHQNH